MDDTADWSEWTSWLFRVEGEMRYQGRSHQQPSSHIPLVCFSGSAILLSAQRLSPDHEGAARGDTEASHLHGVPQLLPLDPRPHRQWVQLQVTPLLWCHSNSLSLYHQCLKFVFQSIEETFSLWTMNQSKFPFIPRTPPPVALSALALSSLFVTFFNIPWTWDDQKSISGHRKTSASWNPPSPPNVHILVSAVRMQPSQHSAHCLISGLIFSAWHWPHTWAALSLVSCPSFGLSLVVTMRLLTSGLCNLFSHRIPLIPAAPHLSAAWGTRVVSKLNFSSLFFFK